MVRREGGSSSPAAPCRRVVSRSPLGHKEVAQLQDRIRQDIKTACSERQGGLSSGEHSESELDGGRMDLAYTLTAPPVQGRVGAGLFPREGFGGAAGKGPARSVHQALPCLVAPGRRAPAAHRGALQGLRVAATPRRRSPDP